MSRYGLRPVPRTTGGAAGADTDVRAAVRVADRGGRGDRLVRAADRASSRTRRRSRSCATRRPRSSSTSRWTSSSCCAARRSGATSPQAILFTDGRHRRGRRGGRGGRGPGRLGRRRAARLAGNREPEGSGAVNHLLRETSRRSPRPAGRSSTARRASGSSPALAARKLVDFAGPHGWDYSATNLGRIARARRLRGRRCRAPPRAAAGRAARRLQRVALRARRPRARRRRHRPRRARRGRHGGSRTPRTSPSSTAGRRPASAASPRPASTPRSALSEDFNAYARHTAEAVETLLRAGIPARTGSRSAPTSTPA